MSAARAPFRLQAWQLAVALVGLVLLISPIISLFSPLPLSSPPSTTTVTTRTGSPQRVLVLILQGAARNPSAPGYDPPSIKVVLGVNSTVTWVNQDREVHTVTATDGSFDSGDLVPSANFTYTLTRQGTYTYFCLYHPWMKGTILVLGG